MGEPRRTGAIRGSREQLEAPSDRPRQLEAVGRSPVDASRAATEARMPEAPKPGRVAVGQVPRSRVDRRVAGAEERAVPLDADREAVRPELPRAYSSDFGGAPRKAGPALAQSRARPSSVGRRGHAAKDRGGIGRVGCREGVGETSSVRARFSRASAALLLPLAPRVVRNVLARVRHRWQLLVRKRVHHDLGTARVMVRRQAEGGVDL